MLVIGNKFDLIADGDYKGVNCPFHRNQENHLQCIAQIKQYCSTLGSNWTCEPDYSALGDYDAFEIKFILEKMCRKIVERKFKHTEKIELRRVIDWYFFDHMIIETNPIFVL